MLILASKSPRRKELLKEIYPDFAIEFADIDEKSSYYLPPLEAVKDIAKRKGEIINKSHYDDYVISADTIVLLDNEILGKPKDQEDAFRILKKLSNKTHEVITAYAIFHQDKVICNEVISKVKFKNLTDSFIKEYIATGSPMDKAGAYGIQDEDHETVESFTGSKTNIIGFPIDEIKSDLIKIGFPC